MRFAIPTIAALGLLAGCASTTPPTAAVPPPPPRNTVASEAPAEQCVQLTRIREAKVVDDRTIDFILRDGKVLRNVLPSSCPQLGFEKAFSYSTSISQLCSVDIITVIIQGGGPRTGASCGLGKFVPYTPIPKDPTAPK
ncbi:hypothetical protein KX816_02525 [Sphingosinicellaceae bacterium]|nr:hypothetical protein KX816_02525 [Sphingosinicellaceae bacterium]